MFFSKITSAIIHNDTSLSLLVLTNNYYDNRMIAQKHVFTCMCHNENRLCMFRFINNTTVDIDNVNTVWTCVYMRIWLSHYQCCLTALYRT